jgi:hypothetical protein
VDPRLLDAGLIALAIGGWLLAYGLARLVTRPVSPRPGPAGPDLGSEPPAVASLLANRWEVTEDAAEATLLDLAGRRLLELRQPGNDPMQTTVHVRDAAGSGLRPYEQRIMDRIGALAVGGVVPVSALTFRDEAQATRWAKRLRAEVVADARALGLSRRRFGPLASGLLVAAAGLAAVLVAVAAGRYALRSPDGDGGLAVGGFVVTFLVLAGAAGRYPGERDTPAGRQAAAQWLGLRDWLRGHEEFAELPPASTTVWDRYLAYGAALGVTRLASAVLDLGMGNRRLVWSSYGGGWRRVRVRYPRLWPRYGMTAPRLIVRALLALGAGVVLGLYRTRPRQWLAGIDPTLAPGRGFDLAEFFGGIAAVVLLGYGGYVLVRTLVDLATERTIDGEVLWVQAWRSASRSDESPRPVLHYLAVDDGTADRTTAWALPSPLSWGCHDGDTVTMRVRRWSRRVLTIQVMASGRRHVSESTVEREADNLVAATFGAVGRAVSGALRAPRVTGATLLTAEEVGQAVGLDVRPPEATPIPVPLGTTYFTTVAKNRAVLVVQVAQGATGDFAWRMNARGTAVPGIADGAYTSGDRAVLRSGGTTVLLTLLGKGKGHRQHLPWLLAQAAGRLAG